MSTSEIIDYPFTYAEFMFDTPNDVTTAVPVIGNTAILLANHMGSSVYNHDGSLGDAGRKARGVAQRLAGYPVIAYDRLGTGPDAPLLQVSPYNAADVIKYTGDKLSDIIDERGYEHVIVAGNSAAGTTAVELAASECLPVSHVAAMDPVAMHKISLMRGFTRWLHFNLTEERNAPKLPRPADDRIEEATGFTAAAFRQDSAAYRKLWESDLAAEAMRKIASRLGHISGRLFIPDRTFTGSIEDNSSLVAELNERRSLLASTEPNTKPFIATIGDGTYHSRYENFDIYASAIAQTIDPNFTEFE